MPEILVELVRMIRAPSFNGDSVFCTVNSNSKRNVRNCADIVAFNLRILRQSLALVAPSVSSRNQQGRGKVTGQFGTTDFLPC
ncbi:hypothetical protein SAMN05216358_0485 [Rhizobium sp. AN5]|nr:hypothetical protein SAMN05216358_0485 [Rhizobium sp. AN5]